MNIFRMFSRMLVVVGVVCAGNVNAETTFAEALNTATDLVVTVVTNDYVKGAVAGVTAAGITVYSYDKAVEIANDGVDQHSLLIGALLGGAVGLHTGDVKTALVAGGATVGAIKLASATKNTELSKKIQNQLGRVAQSSAAQVGGLVAMNIAIAKVLPRVLEKK